MDLLSPREILENLEDIIMALEDDENLFYIAVDLSHQLRDAIKEVVPFEYD